MHSTKTLWSLMSMWFYNSNNNGFKSNNNTKAENSNVIWGNTVNIASRLESNSEVGKVNISQHPFDFIKGDPQFKFESRGKIDVKGKGEMEMYFVSANV